jgi:hypothetical protein
MSIFSVLTCVVSFALQSPVSLNIYNLCQNINLISPVYFIHGGRWDAVPDHEIGANAIMSRCIKFDSGQDILEGALVYKIQRKHVEPTQDELKDIWLLAAWNGKHIKELHVCTLLVEHNKRLDKDKLRRLYQKR